jgi:N-acetyl-anhydromuramyl-L-alanine amidase AmpD
VLSPQVRRWKGSNCWFGRPYGPPIAFVVHTETGGDSGTVAEFLNSSAQFSAHYLASLDGSLDCYVDPGDRSWANGILEPGNLWEAIAAACGVDPDLSPNHVTISCETEDLGDPDQVVTDCQFNAVLYAGREAKLRYPESLRFLTSHADISPLSRANCPGPRWVASGRLRELAEALGLRLVGC